MKTKKTNWWKVTSIILMIVVGILLMAEINNQKTIEYEGIQFPQYFLRIMWNLAIEHNWTEVVFGDLNTNQSVVLQVIQ